jgi:hypothetical protein
MRLVKDFDLVITSQDFKEKGELSGEVRLKDYEVFLEKVNLLKALGNAIHFSNE